MGSRRPLSRSPASRRRTISGHADARLEGIGGVYGHDGGRYLAACRVPPDEIPEGFEDAAHAHVLLRKVKGTLVPTARAETASRQPRALVSSVLKRLPFGRQFEVEAGWFDLLGLAAGEPKEPVDDGVAQMMSDRRWRMSGDSPVRAYDARGAALFTRDTLQPMAGRDRDSDPGLITQLTRATLFGLADSS